MDQIPTVHTHLLAPGPLSDGENPERMSNENLNPVATGTFTWNGSRVHASLTRQSLDISGDPSAVRLPVDDIVGCELKGDALTVHSYRLSEPCTTCCGCCARKRVHSETTLIGSDTKQLKDFEERLTQVIAGVPMGVTVPKRHILMLVNPNSGMHLFHCRTGPFPPRVRCSLRLRVFRSCD